MNNDSPLSVFIYCAKENAMNHLQRSQQIDCQSMKSAWNSSFQHSLPFFHPFSHKCLMTEKQINF